MDLDFAEIQRNITDEPARLAREIDGLQLVSSKKDIGR